jgi:hypothetical protein
MARSIRLGALVATLLLAGCGKVGSPDIPVGSTYPKIYPADAVRPAAPAQSPSSGAVAAFTASGAWIDPASHRLIIDPNADIDQKGSGGTQGTSSPSATSTPKPSNTEAGGAPTMLPAQ